MKRQPPEFIVRITRPELTEAERERRLDQLALAVARLVVGEHVTKVERIKDGAV
jgi:hypothetical protein